MSSFKAQAMARNLREHLELSVKGASFGEANDAGYFPILLVEVGAGLTREAILVKIDMLPDIAQHKDGLDLPQRLFSPHRISILREDAAGAEGIKQPELRERVTAACAAMGAKVRILEKEGVSLETDAANYSDVGATLVAEINADVRQQNPLTNSQ